MADELSAERIAELEEALQRPTCEIFDITDDTCVAGVGHAISCLGCQGITLLCCDHFNEMASRLNHPSALLLIHWCGAPARSCVMSKLVDHDEL